MVKNLVEEEAALSPWPFTVPNGSPLAEIKEQAVGALERCRRSGNRRRCC